MPKKGNFENYALHCTFDHDLTMATTLELALAGAATPTLDAEFEVSKSQPLYSFNNSTNYRPLLNELSSLDAERREVLSQHLEKCLFAAAAARCASLNSLAARLYAAALFFNRRAEFTDEFECFQSYRSLPVQDLTQLQQCLEGLLDDADAVITGAIGAGPKAKRKCSPAAFPASYTHISEEIVAAYFFKELRYQKHATYAIEKAIFLTDAVWAYKHGCTLTHGRAEAWDAGPVYPAARTLVNKWFHGEVAAPLVTIASVEADEVLDAVVHFAQMEGAVELIKLLHKEGPWLSRAKNDVIPEADIVEWYSADPNGLVRRILAQTTRRGASGSAASGSAAASSVGVATD